MHIAGHDALEKYNGFAFDTEIDKLKIDKVIQMFEKDCMTTINVLVERSKFYSRKQQGN